MIDAASPGNASERMGRDWLGLGNLDAPCWFIGMEPGGDEDPTWPETWATRFGGAPMVDLRDSAGEAQIAYLGPDNRLQATWSPLIRMRREGEGVDSSRPRRGKDGAADYPNQ